MLLPNGMRIGRAGSNKAIRVIEGGASEAQAFFGQLSRGGTVVQNANFPGTLVRLPSGGTVGLRSVATSTGSRAAPRATIDVNIPGVNIRELKFLQ